MERATIIGLGGPTCSGKTSLAKALQAKLSHLPLLVLSLDEFYDPSKVPLLWTKYSKEGTAHDFCWLNWESPGCFDWHQIASEIRERSKRKSPSDPSILLIEGFNFLLSEPVVSLLDFIIFLDISKPECLKRRIARQSSYDVIETYLPSSPSSPSFPFPKREFGMDPWDWFRCYFEEVIWPHAQEVSRRIVVHDDGDGDENYGRLEEGGEAELQKKRSFSKIESSLVWERKEKKRPARRGAGKERKGKPGGEDKEGKEDEEEEEANEKDEEEKEEDDEQEGEEGAEDGGCGKRFLWGSAERCRRGIKGIRGTNSDKLVAVDATRSASLILSDLVTFIQRISDL